MEKVENLKRSSTFANRFIDLNSNKHIRKFLAVVLLATFALSNTPTKYLHALFANHRDFVNNTLTDSNSPQLNVTGLNCHCETNVVIAPFTFESVTQSKCLSPDFIVHSVTLADAISFTELFSFGLRGPPSIA